MDDLTTIRRVLAGEVEAYALLVAKYHRNLLAFIFRIVKDQHLAEDIGQEVFLKVYKQLASFDPNKGTPFSAWLYIAARNQCLGELRKLRRSGAPAEDEVELLADERESAETTLIRQEEVAALRATVQELPEPFRTTIVMSLRGATLEEIAASCGVGPATVKTRLFRAKEKLLLLWKGELGGVGHEHGI